MKPSIASLVNYCSNEARFLQPCVEELKLFSTAVYIVVCDHFFDGTEDKELEKTFQAFPECNFIFYPFCKELENSKKAKKIGQNFWVSFSRALAFRYLKEDFVLFLDVDEVLEGERFRNWLESGLYQNYECIKLANYWYFRTSFLQAKALEDSAVLAKRKELSFSKILHRDDRNALYNTCKKRKIRGVLGLDGRPLIHHYSWVRTKEEMLKKVLSWGHKEDREWVPLVEEEFSHPPSKKDFVHGYELEEVLPFKNISFEKVSFASKGKAQVIRLTEKEVKETLVATFLSLA